VFLLYHVLFLLLCAYQVIIRIRRCALYKLMFLLPAYL